jgi:hypothetical protein
MRSLILYYKGVEFDVMLVTKAENNCCGLDLQAGSGQSTDVGIFYGFFTLTT